MSYISGVTHGGRVSTSSVWDPLARGRKERNCDQFKNAGVFSTFRIVTKRK